MAVRRFSAEDDFSILGDMVVAFQKEHTANFPYDLSHFVGFLERNIDNPDVAVFVLDEDQGMLVAMLMPTEFAPEKVGREVLWYTRPESRGKGYSLFRAYEKWARDGGAHYVFCALKQAEPVMERLGFTQVDVSYFKRIVPEVELSHLPSPHRFDAPQIEGVEL